MRARPVIQIPIAAVALLCAALAAWSSLRYDFAFTDYDTEASASVARLLHGDLGGFLSLAPSYGGSLVIRSPIVVLTGLAGGGELAAYRALALPALIALALVAIALGRTARRRGWRPSVVLIVVALALLNRPALQALEFGHPEELLGAALCVGATLSAIRGRWALAAVLLGLAVANKPWALVAVAPVLLALPAARARAAILAAVIAALIMAPLMLAGTGSHAAMAVATSAGGFAKPLEVWWFAGRRLANPEANGLPQGTREPPAWVSKISRPLIMVVAVSLSLLWWRRRLPAADALGLLALVLFARCLLDPWTNPYYHLPFLLALLAWEVHGARRWPAFSVSAALFLQLLALVPTDTSPDLVSAAYVAVALPAFAALALAVLAPRRARAPRHAAESSATALASAGSLTV